jgi:FkbM family methyltransferase
MMFYRPFLREPAKHLYKLATIPEYRTLATLTARYGRVPRFTQRKVRLHGWQLTVPDVLSFLGTYQWIFLDQTYAFRTDNPSPLIVDCGANIGMSILYFKRLYPKARIIAFEADPKLFRILEENIRGNGITDVELINKAVWSSETTLTFLPDGADAGRITEGNGGSTNGGAVKVPTVRLRDYLADRTVDLLKVDIEGAEIEVLHDCPDVLNNVKAVCLEFHSYAHKTQGLGDMIKLFEDRGFRTHVGPPVHCSKAPLMKLNVDPASNTDLQLHLFFFRP